jgi:ribosomal protein L14
MAGKQSVFFVIDNSGAKTGFCVNVYKTPKCVQPGSLVTVSIQRCKLLSKLSKGQLFRAVVVQINRSLFRGLGYYVKFNKNGVVLLKRFERAPFANRIAKYIVAETREQGFNRVAALSLGLFLNLCTLS